MFVYTGVLQELIKENHQYFMDALQLPKERIPDGYFEDMLSTQQARLKRLKFQSCNDRLIAKMEKIIELEKQYFLKYNN